MTTLRTCATTVISLIICIAPSAWGQQFLLYSPQPVASSQKVSPQDGILVQEIKIKKGDTLYDLSRKYNGRGTYFPQILLFNSIKNPNLIYAGSTLKIPVAQSGTNNSNRTDAQVPDSANKAKASVQPNTPLKVEAHAPAGQATDGLPVAAPGTDLSLTELKSVDTHKQGAGQHKKKTALNTRKSKLRKTSAASTTASPLPIANKDAANGSATPAGDVASGQKLFEAAAKAYRLDDCRTALELLDRYLLDNSSSPLAADANLYKADCYLKMSAQ